MLLASMLRLPWLSRLIFAAGTPSFTSCYRAYSAAQSYARSLARQMHRLAQAPEFLEALCN
jgi:hypothetical protein